MAGIFALAYGLIKGTALIVDDIQQKKVEDIEYSAAFTEGSKVYSHNGQLYWTATKTPCHIYIEPNGNKQIRSGCIYGQGIVLLDYSKEIYREYNEKEKIDFELAEKEYFTKNNRYYNTLGYNYDFKEKKRYVTRCSEENDLYWIDYLVEHNGIWCYDDIHSQSKSISREEWIACGSNLAKKTSNVPYLSKVLEKEKKEKEERKLKEERTQMLKLQKEQEGQLNKEILVKSWGMVFILTIILILLVCI